MQLIDLAYCSDEVVNWEVYKEGDNIVSKYLPDDWRNIAADIDSESELIDLLNNYPSKIQGFVLYENQSRLPIAFVYILKERRRVKTISIHGGGWLKSIKHTFLYYRGCALLIACLINNGYRVLTYADVENKKAINFMQGLGFVKYRIVNNRVYQWITIKRLQNSKVYKYIINQR